MKIVSMDKQKTDELSDILKTNKSVEFKYKDLHYQIFENFEYGYVVNVYSSNEKDEDNNYLDSNMIDGGLCTGSAKDAIGFMI